MKSTHKREFYAPENARKVAMKNGGAVFYLYENMNGIPLALCFIGRAQKPSWHYRFTSPEKREKRIREQIEILQERERRKIEQRAQANKPHNWSKGLILAGSWGYEQTNVNFFEVINVIGRTMVEVEEIGQMTATDSGKFSHGMADHVVPDPETRTGKISRVKVQRGSIKSPVYGYASPWDGKPKYHSWYN